MEEKEAMKGAVNAQHGSESDQRCKSWARREGERKQKSA